MRAIVKRDLPAIASASRQIVREYRDHIAKAEELLFSWTRTVIASPAAVAEMTEVMRGRRRQADLLSC